MSTNPYAPPTTPLKPIPQWSDICVDGRFLVVRDGMTLPNRCPFTNEPISPLALREYIYDATPSFRLVLRRSRCRLFYGVAPAIRQQWIRQTCTVIITGGIALVGFGFLLNKHPVSLAFLIVFWLMLTISMASRPYGTLKVNKSEGGRVWLDGCCLDFLAYIRQKYGSLNTHISQRFDDFAE